ncbi:unnamed protein product, partial [marine sediment metagenome]
AYRKIRNTLRYLLGNTNDFDPNVNSVAYDEMFEIDKWAMQQLQKLIAGVTEAYENFVFHRVFSLLYNFCTVEMSSIYMDVLKDRMYCDAADSLSRRSSQTAMHSILDCLIRMLTPILVHTMEEAWAEMESKTRMRDEGRGTRDEGRGTRGERRGTRVESVHLALMPKVDDSIDYRSAEPRWQKLMALRDEVLCELENLRRKKDIASNQEATVRIRTTDEELLKVLHNFGEKNFASLCIVSEIKFEKPTDTMSENGVVIKDFYKVPMIIAQKSSYNKCQRCWNYWPSVGADSEHPDLCKRCVSVVH